MGSWGGGGGGSGSGSVGVVVVVVVFIVVVSLAVDAAAAAAAVSVMGVQAPLESVLGVLHVLLVRVLILLLVGVLVDRMFLLEEHAAWRSDEHCNICLHRGRNARILPCHHVIGCSNCMLELSKGPAHRRKCPICREPFSELQVADGVARYGSRLFYRL